ncbi:MAG: septal ring lytic transglycosylase RlpA family protein [Spirochaetaceae bacterium]|jgi:rare lipoprotein A|nr:septal ring lytic transglycosylase RlpA family protein [Spirochaetaceae bacterium]
MKRIIPLVFMVFLSPVLLINGQTQSGSAGGLFRQEGIASWYGDEFAGRLTASGEIFDPALLTAAHQTLPLGTMLKVTNTHNNKQVLVRVNDRGPFVAARIIDVSRAAAEQLDMIFTGTAPVVVEALAPLSVSSALPPDTQPLPVPVPVPQAPATVLSPEPPLPPAVPAPVSAAGNSGQGYAPQAQSNYTGLSQQIPLTAAVIPGIPAAGTGKHYRLQVGSYKAARYALAAFDKLKNLGLTPAYERYGEYYRVVLSGVKAEEVPSLTERLGTAGFPEILIREER